MIVIFVILSAISSLFGISRLVSRGTKPETEVVKENRRVGGMLGLIGGATGFVASIFLLIFRRKKKLTPQQIITSDIRSRLDQLKNRLDKNKKSGLFNRRK
jgi:hypothetical protein